MVVGGAGCAGLCRMQGGGVVVRAWQLLCIWSRQWQVVVHLALSAPTEWDQIACSCRGMMVQAGEENGRKLSVGKEWGTWGYSQRKLIHLRSLRSSAPLFFPRRSLGGKKQEVARGGVALWKESYPRAQRETHVTVVVTFHPCECCFSMGGAQAWNTLAVFVSDVQGILAQVTKTALHSMTSSLIEWRSCSRRWRTRNLRSLGECPHYIAICPAHSGGLSSHRLCSSATEPLIFSALHKPMAVQLHWVIKKRLQYWRKGTFPYRLNKTQYKV